MSKINFQKCFICVSPNVPRSEVNRIRETLGVEMVQGHAKYLGLSSAILRNKSNVIHSTIYPTNDVTMND